MPAASFWPDAATDSPPPRRRQRHSVNAVDAAPRTSEADRQAGQALGAAILARTAPPVGPHDPVGCRFIDGNVRAHDWRYCQQPQQPGSAYCPEHHARCYHRRGEQ